MVDGKRGLILQKELFCKPGARLWFTEREAICKRRASCLQKERQSVNATTWASSTLNPEGAPKPKRGADKLNPQRGSEQKEEEGEDEQ